MSEDLFSLKGCTALITGGSRGIGFGLAQGLGKAGAEIIINGRNEPALEAAVKTLQQQDIQADFKIFDVCDHEAVASAINQIESTGRRIDILVNNAGMQHRQALHEFEYDKFEQIISTNLTSVFSVSQAVARYMIKRQKGKIINIASVMSLLARPSVAPYTATKGAVSNLTKGMAADWGPLGLNCNAIAPGYFRTELNKALTEDQLFSEWLIKRTPAGRWGDVDELVGAAVFLASRASDFVNGQTIFVDGGITATV